MPGNNELNIRPQQIKSKNETVFSIRFHQPLDECPLHTEFCRKFQVTAWIFCKSKQICSKLFVFLKYFLLPQRISVIRHIYLSQQIIIEVVRYYIIDLSTITYFVGKLSISMWKYLELHRQGISDKKHLYIWSLIAF